MTPLDNSAAKALHFFAGLENSPLTDLSPQSARQRYLNSYLAEKIPFEEVDTVSEFTVNNRRVKYWRGTKAPKTAARALLYFHGGGWLLGSPETHEDICRMIANRTEAVVFCPDYRLAPEHPFPTGLNDCIEAFNHIHDHPLEFGIDCSRIAVAGDSAGGNLAAVLAILSRDQVIPPITTQILIYPNTDQRQLSVSYQTFAHGFGLTAEEMAWFTDHYLPSAELRENWQASPILVPSLDGVASAIVVLAGKDILFTEGVAYANRLACHVDTSIKTWPGQIHGFISMSKLIPEASEAISEICNEWLRLDTE